VGRKIKSYQIERNNFSQSFNIEIAILEENKGQVFEVNPSAGPRLATIARVVVRYLGVFYLSSDFRV